MLTFKKYIVNLKEHLTVKVPLTLRDAFNNAYLDEGKERNLITICNVLIIDYIETAIFMEQCRETRNFH